MAAGHVAPEGTFNFRDVGGMPLATGGAVRPGVLFRSDALSGLTSEGGRQLAETGIGVIVDFRTPIERQLSPDRLPAETEFRMVHLELLEGALSGLADQALSAQGAQAEAAVEQTLARLPELSALYESMLTHGAAVFAEFTRLVADPPAPAADREAVLVHCTAGKDRTGVSVALVLDAVGVRREALIADYASSQANLAGAWADRMFGMIAAMGVPRTPALEELIALTPASAITTALEWVDREHGGSAAYLQSGGATEDDLGRLRQRLVG